MKLVQGQPSSPVFFSPPSQGMVHDHQYDDENTVPTTEPCQGTGGALNQRCPRKKTVLPELQAKSKDLVLNNRSWSQPATKAPNSTITPKKQGPGKSLKIIENHLENHLHDFRGLPLNLERNTKIIPKIMAKIIAKIIVDFWRQGRCFLHFLQVGGLPPTISSRIGAHPSQPRSSVVCVASPFPKTCISTYGGSRRCASQPEQWQQQLQVSNG